MAEQKFVLTSCCCGCSLRTGSLIIGALSLILSLIGLSLGIFGGIIGITEGWVDVAIDAVNIILAILLIHGIRTDRLSFINTWVWATVITVTLTVILGVFIVLLNSSLLAAVLLFTFVAFQCYFILVVRSYAVSLEAPELPVALETVPSNTSI